MTDNKIINKIIEEVKNSHYVLLDDYDLREYNIWRIPHPLPVRITCDKKISTNLDECVKAFIIPIKDEDKFDIECHILPHRKLQFGFENGSEVDYFEVKTEWLYDEENDLYISYGVTIAYIYYEMVEWKKNRF